METNIKVLGWLHIALHAVTLLGGVFAFFFLSLLGGAVAASGEHGTAGMGALMGGIGFFVLGFFAILSLPGIIIGWGLINYKPWARPLGMVLSIIELIHVPLGTALGVYGLVVLFDSQTAALFDQARY